jgi:predicted small secreted protein
MSKIMMALALTCFLLSACARDETGEGEDTAVMEDTTAAVPEPVGISLADVAGTWVINARSETGQEVPQYELVATADPSGWEIRFPDRDPIPAQVVEVSGDSIVSEAGPYESVLRPGVQVTTRSVYRLEGDRLIGTTVAHYQTTDADSVVIVRGEGTRAP